MYKHTTEIVGGDRTHPIKVIAHQAGKYPRDGGAPRLGFRRGVLITLALIVVLAGCFAPSEPEEAEDEDEPGSARPPFSPDDSLGTTRLFAQLEEPGYPEGILVQGDRLYTSSAAFVESGIVFEHNLTTGELVDTIGFEPPDRVRGWERSALGMTHDADGQLYVAELIGARIVRIDPKTPEDTQITYAEIPDLPPCHEGPQTPCAPTREPQPPVPNDAKFGPGGALYVSDTYQHTIWRIPPGGGEAEAWYQDPRFETAQFGMNGIAFGPDDDHLYISHSIVGLAAGGQTAPAGAAVWRLPFTDAPTSADLELFHAYPGVLVDGFAFSASGKLYVTVLGVPTGSHGISVLDPDGEQEHFFPTTEANEAQEIPYDGPASIAFHDDHRSILVTNLAQSEPDHWAVLEAYVDDTVLPLHRPDVPVMAPG